METTIQPSSPSSPSTPGSPSAGPPGSKDVGDVARFLVLPLDFRDLWVGERPLAEYLAAQGDDERRRFADDATMADAEFRARLGERLGPAMVPFQAPGVFTLRASLERWVPGEWFLLDAEAELVLTIFDDHAREVERIRLSARETANVHNPSPRDRLRSCARKLADRAARFLDLTSD